MDTQIVSMQSARGSTHQRQLELQPTLAQISGVKHAKEADRGAEMLGIASDWEEGFGTLSYLFCRQDCEIDFLRSWKHLDVSELRHSANSRCGWKK